MTLLQVDQTQLLQVSVIASPFRWTKGALTALAQMTNQTALDVPVHRTHRFSRVAKRKVVGPPALATIDRLDQLGNRHTALAAADHCAKRLPVFFKHLLGRCHVQAPLTPML